MTKEELLREVRRRLCHGIKRRALEDLKSQLSPSEQSRFETVMLGRVAEDHNEHLKMELEAIEAALMHDDQEIADWFGPLPDLDVTYFLRRSYAVAEESL